MLFRSYLQLIVGAGLCACPYIQVWTKSTIKLLATSCKLIANFDEGEIIMSVLVTGGLGYIGSHTCVELINSGVDIVVVDNLYNCKKSSYDRIKALVGKDFPFYECDIRDAEGLQKVFDNEDIDSCIHFAGLKAVGESCEKPLEYFDNNVTGTLDRKSVV